jgi:hypothetical protein
MGTRDWWLESSVENQSLLRPCPPVSGGARAQRYCTGQRILDTKSQKLDVKKLNK